MGNKSVKQNVVVATNAYEPIKVVVTTHPSIILSNYDGNIQFANGIFEIELRDIINPINENKFELYYKIKDDDDWKNSMIDINGSDTKLSQRLIYIKLPLYIYAYSVKCRMKCQHISTQKYSEYSNIIKISVPSIFTVKLSTAHFKTNIYALKPMYDLSSYEIKINEYQNLLLPRTNNKEYNTKILNMFVTISKLIELESVNHLKLNKIDSYYFAKSISKYIIDFLYKSKTDYRPPKIYAFYETEDYDKNCYGSIKILPFRKYREYNSMNIGNMLFICGLCGITLNGYNWFSKIDHTECKSNECNSKQNNFIFTCLSCINQFLQKYMLLYGYLNDILRETHSMNTNCVQEIVSYAVGNIVLHEKGVWSHVNDIFFDFFF